MLELKTIAVREDGCFSVLLWEGRPFAVSVERTFDGDKPVIGNGGYDCVASRYVKGGYDTFEIIVAGHTRILFHKGNTELDSIGCVVIGNAFEFWRDVTVVTDSKAGFDKFAALTAGLKGFKLTVSGR